MWLNFRLFFNGILRVLGQPHLMLLPQPLDHVDQVTILAVQLFYALLITLEASDAHLVTSWQFVLVFLEVLRNFFRVMLIEEPYGAHGSRARRSY
jgi:hypothetical protein